MVTGIGDRMKTQTGIWVDGQAWKAYRDLCRTEKLRPAEPIEEFVKSVLRKGSALTVLSIMQGVEKARSEGLEAYARVLLNWYVNGKEWISISDENDAPIEPMLLNVLRDVNDLKLRREIQEALVIKPRKERSRRKKDERIENEKSKVTKNTEKKSTSLDEMQKKMDELKKTLKDRETVRKK